MLTKDPGERRYFQTRAASELRRSLSERGWPTELPLRCCDVRNDPASVDPFAFRDAGFRILISLQDDEEQTAPVFNAQDGGLLDIRGGIRIRAEDAPSAIFARAHSSASVFRFSLFDLYTKSKQKEWATALSDAFWQGRAFVTLPSDYLLQHGRGITSRLGLILETPDAKNPTAPIKEIMNQFSARGWSLSLVDPGLAGRTNNDYWDCDPREQAEPSLSKFQCRSSAEDAISEIGDRVALLNPDTEGGWTGLRADGVFQITTEFWPQGGLTDVLRVDPFSDRSLVLRSDDIRTPIQRRKVLADLDAYSSLNRTGVLSVERLATELLTPPPALDRVWSHRERMALDPPRAQTLDSEARASLLDDARIAWNFILTHSDPRTGLCPGTVDLAPGGSRDDSITMWDVASQILGTLGAGSSGLIDQAEVTDRIEGILSNLPVTSLGGHKLPPSFFHASSLRAQELGFDSCDTGRFLNALSVAVDTGAISRDAAEECINQWDLSAAVQDGRLYNFGSGRFHDVTNSHCNAYVRRGYQRWGFEVERALPPIPDDPSTDDLMALVFAAGDIGAYGTEPMLLDILETGADPAIQYLAELLFDAQLSWFEDTGEFKCVSESPLNFAPWFIYNGLRVDRAAEDAWTLLTLAKDRTYQTEDFKRKAEVLSTKSAYLWEALFPHPYSTKLRELMQEKARIQEQGFSAGLFARDLSPMENYSDLNTNGIILSAVARMLE
ncbi:DUF3131 domain-containing protein [Actibacterium pelagium]|uniref:DUF3131 domain-containing protein n=1 Tax=Actibacterium pelagium TaxID=2029103 RepID=UPI001304256E|nr:DUF3131 domain-containing protein [Actibacterium pelagium]